MFQPVQQMSVPRQVMRMPRPLSSLMGIPHTSLQKVRKLGEGEFGVVLEGIYTSSDGSKVWVCLFVILFKDLYFPFSLSKQFTCP